MLRVVMPTLVWVCRPKSGTIGAAAAVPDPVHVALPAAVSSKRCADAGGGKRKKRKEKSRAKAATTAKRRSKAATSERDIPRGIRKLSSGKFASRIGWGGKTRKIGTFYTPEQASAAYMSVRKDLDDVKLSACGASEVDAIFDAAQTKALEAVGGKVPKERKSKTSSERDLPRGVYKLSSGKYETLTRSGGKTCYIGSFDTPEQASAAYMSVRKDLDDAKQSALSAHEVNAAFDAAKKKDVEALDGFTSETRDLPTGVRKTASGNFRSEIYWYGKNRQIGTFDTPEQASIAYMSVRKDLDDAKLSALGADEGKATFDEAKKKALEMVQAMMNSDGFIV